MQIDNRAARRMLQRLAADGYLLQEGGVRRRFRVTLRLAELCGRLLLQAAHPADDHPRKTDSAESTARAAVVVWANNLRRVRQDLRPTQAAVAGRIGVDAAYYARIERGQVDLRLSTMVRVTKALEVSMEELLGC